MPGLRRPNAPVKGVNIQPYPVLKGDGAGPEFRMNCYPLVNELECPRIFRGENVVDSLDVFQTGSRARTGVVGEHNNAIGKFEGRNGQGFHQGGHRGGRGS